MKDWLMFIGASFFWTAALMGVVKAQNFEYTGTQRHLSQINVYSTTHQVINGAGIGVANVDGFPELDHPDNSSVVVNLFGHSYNSTSFWSQHATHNSITISGKVNGVGVVGVAPRASVYNYPIASTYFTPFTSYHLIYNDAVARGLKIVNHEFQFARFEGGVYKLEGVFGTGELDTLAAYPQLVFVRPTGNQGKVLLNQYYPLRAAGRLNHLLLIGSVDGGNRIAYNSNTPGERCYWAIGDTVCREAEKLKYYFVVAPGHGVLSGYPVKRWQYMYGTSMAAPQVSGALALMFQRAQQLGKPMSATVAAQIIKETAVDLGVRGVDSTYGWGLINVQAAIDRIDRM